MFKLLRRTIHVSKAAHGSRFQSTKCIADLKLSNEKSRQVMDRLNNTSSKQLLQLPMVTHNLARTLDDHKNKFGRITLHTTWSKITGLDLELMKELCIMLSENKDAGNLSMNTEVGEEDVEDEEELQVEEEEEEGEKEVSHKAPNFITKLDDESVAVDEPVPSTLKTNTEKLTTDIQTGQEDKNKILEYSLGLNLIVPSMKTKTLPSSIVAVSIETSSIAWCSMTSDLRVQNWELRPILSTQGGKNTFPQIYEEFSSLHSAMPLPTEDGVYVTEESGSRVPVFKARHEALFFTIAAERQAAVARQANNDHDQPTFSNHVYRLKPSVVINMFNLDVGGQRVSCNNTILDIKRKKCRAAEGVYIPDFLYSQWYRLRRYDQYIAGNSLLTALAFYDKLRSSAKTEKSPLAKKERSQNLSAEL